MHVCTNFREYNNIIIASYLDQSCAHGNPTYVAKSPSTPTTIIP